MLVLRNAENGEFRRAQQFPEIVHDQLNFQRESRFSGRRMMTTSSTSLAVRRREGLGHGNAFHTDQWQPWWDWKVETPLKIFSLEGIAQLSVSTWRVPLKS
jgi:hypothetical protein